MLRTGNLLMIALTAVFCIIFTLSLTAGTTASDPKDNTPPVKKPVVVKKLIQKNMTSRMLSIAWSRMDLTKKWF